ncbi:uncharacterized protein LOC142332961 [Lycorma delicatula]|uniref:uncharacterized protein LOC142332961 n=1 Tax=Lycorma delicatula TaxID=130591 RepID=UPI003F51550F
MKLILIFICALLLVSAAQRRPPNYSLDEMPRTSFSCRDKIVGGYYADPETDCQMFHVCVRVAGLGVQDFRFLCPNDTSFDQENQICDDWYNIDCEASTLYYSDNFDLYRLADGVPEFGPSRATPISLGPSSIAPQPYNKPRRPHTPVNNAVSEDDDDSYLFKSDTGDRRLHKDLLRGSSSGNFFANKNQGKEDNEYEDVATQNQDSSRNQLSQSTQKKKPAKGVVRKLLTGKRPIQNQEISTTTTASSNIYNNNIGSRNKYNTVQRNRPTTAPTTESINYYQSTAAAPSNNYNSRNNYNSFNSYQTSSTTIAPSAAATYNNYNNNNNNNNFKSRGNTNYNSFTNKAETPTTTTINYYSQQSTTTAPVQNYNNYNNNNNNNYPQYNYNNNQYQTSTNSPFNTNNYYQSTNNAQTTKLQQSQSSTSSNNYYQQPAQTTNNYYQQYNNNKSPSTDTYQQTTTVKPINNNYYSQQNNYNNQQQTSTTYNYDYYYQTSSTTAAPNFANYYTTQATPFVNNNNNYEQGTSTTQQNSNYQTKNLYNYNLNAANTATSAVSGASSFTNSQQNYDPYNSYHNNNNDRYDEQTYGESLKTAPSSNIKPSDINSFQTYQQKQQNNGFNTTVAASYNFNTEPQKITQTSQKLQTTTKSVYSTPKPNFYTVAVPTTKLSRNLQQNNNNYQSQTSTTLSSINNYNTNRGNNVYTTSSPIFTETKQKNNNYDTYKTEKSFQSPPLTQQSTTIKTAAVSNKKEKDASYDYAYYDDGSPSEYDAFEPVGEEFVRTTKKSKRGIKN